MGGKDEMGLDGEAEVLTVVLERFRPRPLSPGVSVAGEISTAGVMFWIVVDEEGSFTIGPDSAGGSCMYVCAGYAWSYCCNLISTPSCRQRAIRTLGS